VGSTTHASPAVGTDGTVYVGTGSGYLIAIGPAGVLEWSYTVEGAIAWAPVVDRVGRIYVATTAQRLYSFQPNGSLGWQSRTPSHIAGELALSGASGVLFGGTDGNVWAYSEHGTPLWHAEVRAPVTAGPVFTGNHFAVGTASGDALELEGTIHRRVVPIGDACDAIVRASPDGSLVVVAGGALIGVSAAGSVQFRRDDVAFAVAADSGYLAVDRSGALLRLSSSGALVSSIALGAQASAAPVLAPSGAVYVAGVAGSLAVVPPGGVPRWVPIAHAALHRPVVDQPRRRVLVTAGDGMVAALHLEE
jgi:outer membrane protein assembly factor BamB